MTLTTRLLTNGPTVSTSLAGSLSPARFRVQVAKSLAEYILDEPFSNSLATPRYGRDRITSRWRHFGISRPYDIPGKWTSYPSPDRLASWLDSNASVAGVFGVRVALSAERRRVTNG